MKGRTWINSYQEEDGSWVRGHWRYLPDVDSDMPLTDPPVPKEGETGKAYRSRLRRWSNKAFAGRVDMKFRDLKPEYAYQVATVTRKMAALFPALFREDDPIKIWDSDVQFTGWSANAYASVDAPSWEETETRTMGFSPKFFSEGAEAEARWARQAEGVKPTWHAKSGFDSYVVHEFGHIIDDYMRRFGEDDWDAGIEKLAKSPIRVSGYAGASPEENFAETFARWFLDEERMWPERGNHPLAIVQTMLGENRRRLGYHELMSYEVA